MRKLIDEWSGAFIALFVAALIVAAITVSGAGSTITTNIKRILSSGDTSDVSELNSSSSATLDESTLKLITNTASSVNKLKDNVSDLASSIAENAANIKINANNLSAFKEETNKKIDDINTTIKLLQGATVKDMSDRINVLEGYFTSGVANKAAADEDGNNIKSTYVSYKALKEELLDDIYPVGSIYTSVNNTSPEAKLGGKWERVAKGKTLVGVDEDDADYATAEKTGGSKSVKLTVANLPAHTHTFTATGTVKSTFTGSSVSTSSSGIHSHTGSGWTSTNGAHSHGIYGGIIDGAWWSIGNSSAGSWWGTTKDYNGWNSYRLTTDGDHSHYYSFTTSSDGSHTHTVTAAGSVSSTFTGTSSTTSSTGSGKSVDTRDPYYTVYMWKRVA